MQITITINTDNAAFEGDPGVELSRILTQLAQEFEQTTNPHSGKICDINGNTVGKVEVSE